MLVRGEERKHYWNTTKSFLSV